jgi:hypothetical protein
MYLRAKWNSATEEGGWLHPFSAGARPTGSCGEWFTPLYAPGDFVNRRWQSHSLRMI